LRSHLVFFWELAIFVITLAATGRGTGNNLSLLSAIYIGYQISYLESVIGLTAAS
jgi:hypothetical protein